MITINYYRNPLKLKHSCTNLWDPIKLRIAHVCSIHVKNDPHLISNYRPISLLSSISKVLEKIIQKYVFNLFHENRIITSLQTDFVPNDSSSNQLVSIHNYFSQALDEGKEVRAVCCDISRVWHRTQIYRLKTNGITGGLLDWFKNYLSRREQKVVLS